MGIPSVFARVSQEAVLLDMRTVDASEADALARSVKQAIAVAPSTGSVPPS